MGGGGGCVNLQELLCEAVGGAKTVFVTSQQFTMDLFGEAQNFADCGGGVVTTGLEGADCICQELADAEGLSGTYKAWLSDSMDSPSTSFSKSACPYVMVNDVTVADNWVDLTDGDIQNSIRIDETGVTQANGNENDVGGNETVLTNTLQDGTSKGAQNCGDWTINDQSIGKVRGGQLDDSNKGWTDEVTFSWGCGSSSNFSLYCFEQ